jgi:hypothetical protein
MPATQHTNGSSQASIFARLWESNDGTMPLGLAQYIVKLKFPKQDRVRMHQLAEMHQDGALSPAELEELDNYVKTGDLLAILQSIARRTIKNKKAIKTARHE